MKPRIFALLAFAVIIRPHALPTCISPVLQGGGALLFNLFCGFSPPKKWPAGGRLLASAWHMERAPRIRAATHSGSSSNGAVPTGDRVLFAL